MSSNTDSTFPLSDPEPDGDQLPVEDTLTGSHLADKLDEGYSPNDFPRAGLYDDTPEQDADGLGISRELAQEEPDEWETPDSGDEDRAGRLVDDPDAADGRENDVFAVDEGIDGGGASAEEAAVHIVSDEDPA
ncbi:DUF5709 domain-containing protein [Rarobacter faecitabidus]|uniref:DUF5709 domain-containing protein n=1 Tax=Rarobacter faecitabidus TaxID=13243 RepID=A0A542ZXJ7_RARFA|nr:DUF5709 domain-containing protein [Rarobacter faecitabidus]TQL65065.1 hypothetical protein FB461_1598 [Rarobacter faecitabidus]